MANDWDDSLAAALVGKYALVGLTFVNADGTVRKQFQIHGRITAVDETLVTMRLHESEELFTLPPIWEAFEPAEPGEYRLRSSGEVVMDPDVLAKFKIVRPATNPDD